MPLDDRMERKQLNEALGLAIRRAFQLQLPKRRFTPIELRQHFSELYVVLDALVQPQKTALVRRVFADPETQWLSRSSMESGVAMMIGGYLVHLAELPASADTMDTVARAVLHVLLDQLLRSCSERTGCLSAVCEWRHFKPMYHTMPCFAIWTTLSPMAERLANRFPHVLIDALDSYADQTAGRRRVNCNFAQVSGLWHLIEALGAVDKVSKEVLTALVRFLIQSVVLHSNGEAVNVAEESATEVDRMRMHEEVINTANYHDLLMDKFFSGLQTFLFHCKGSKKAAESAMQTTILERLTTNSSISLSLTVFTSVSSAFVNGLASRIASTLIKALQTTQQRNESTLLFCVGLCAHLDLVPSRIVLLCLHHLLARYAAVPSDDAHGRQKMFFLLLYVAVHRQQVVNEVREGQTMHEEIDAMESGKTNTTEWNGRLSLLSFQERVIEQVQEVDFYVMPIAWMHILWTKWLGLSEEEATAFSESARQMQNEVSADIVAIEKQPQDEQDLAPCKIFPSNKVVTGLPFRRIAHHYALLETLQRTHWIAPVDLESLLEKQQRRRMKLLAAQRKRIKHLAPAAHEQRLNVLMLPEVMQVMCSFMSAKRLCRMSLVCRSFNEVSHLESLWQNLYSARVASALSIGCVHGPAYSHDWKRMYVQHVQAMRKMRKRKRNIAKLVAPQDSEDGASADTSDPPPAQVVRICPHCDCYAIVTTQQELDQHFLMHEQFQCSRIACGASFGCANQYRRHLQMAHPKPMVMKKTFPCPVDGCEADSFSTAAELKKHMKQQHSETIEKKKFACSADGCKKVYVSEKCFRKHLLTHGPEAEAAS